MTSRPVYLYSMCSTSTRFKPAMVSKTSLSALTRALDVVSQHFVFGQGPDRACGEISAAEVKLKSSTGRRRVLACHPQPTSNKPPVVSFIFPFVVSELKRSTLGTPYSGITTGCLFLSLVLDSATAKPPVLATGAIVLTRILCFCPSRAVASEMPRIPNF